MDTEKILAGFAKTKMTIAELQKDTTIGQHIIELISRNGEISIASLIQSLQEAIDTCPSSKGKGRPDQDLQLLQAETALVYVKSLIPGV